METKPAVYSTDRVQTLTLLSNKFFSFSILSLFISNEIRDLDVSTRHEENCGYVPTDHVPCTTTISSEDWAVPVIDWDDINSY